MNGLEIPLKILIALALGAVIGLEREINEKKNIGAGKQKAVALLGLRSFALTTGLGVIAGFSQILGFPALAIFIGVSFIILLTIFYVLDSSQTKDPGLTTEVALVYSFVLGALIAIDIFPMQVIIAITIVLILLLSRKSQIKGVIEDIQKREINAFISYAILALVILPFLPNTSITLSDMGGVTNFFKQIGFDASRIQNIEIINPFKLWMIVVLITGVDMGGYILEKTLGQKRGWIAASVAGGFISSTATVVSLAKQSKETARKNPLLAAAMFANMVSFFPILIIIATLNIQLFQAAFLTLALIIVSAGAIGTYFLVKREAKATKVKQKAKQDKIFSLTTALKFAGLYLAVSIVSRLALEFFGQTGFLLASGIGALPGIDAVVINTAQLAGERISLFTATLALIIINAVNLIAKSVYSFTQGDKSFATKYAISMAIIIGASLLGLLFV